MSEQFFSRPKSVVACLNLPPSLSLPFYISFPSSRLLSSYLLTQAALEDFFVTLALCHTVQVASKAKAKREVAVTSDGNVQMADLSERYQASSPDEKALVEACAR